MNRRKRIVRDGSSPSPAPASTPRVPPSSVCLKSSRQPPVQAYGTPLLPHRVEQPRQKVSPRSVHFTFSTCSYSERLRVPHAAMMWVYRRFSDT